MSTYFIDILETAIPISLLIAILLVISPFIKKSYAASWRYFMWLLIAVRLILPFRIPIGAGVTMEIPRELSGVAVAAEAASSVSVQSVLMYAWLAGTIVFALFQTISYISFKRHVKRWSKKVTDERTLGIFEQIKAELNEKRRVDFLICKSVSTPMIFGIIKPKLLLPGDSYTEEEIKVILRHELIHLKRNDIWYKLILTLANCINWFNPLVYLMISAANRDIELACDAEVVREQDMEYRRGYCRAILTVVHNKRTVAAPLSTCFVISRRVVEERLRDILSLKKKRKGIVMFTAVALSAVVCGGAVTFATEKAADVLEEELNIVERPTPQPKAEPQPAAAEQQEYSSAPVQESRSRRTDYDDASYSYSEYYAPQNVAEGYTIAEGEEVNELAVVEQSAVEEVSMGTERGDVYNRLGEPDATSVDGSREIYDLPDGNTAVLQYDGDTLDSGYILVN